MTDPDDIARDRAEWRAEDNLFWRNHWHDPTGIEADLAAGREETARDEEWAQW